MNGDVPEVVKSKLNWGAFFLSWIWGIGNGVWLALFALCPVMGFAVHIYIYLFMAMSLPGKASNIKVLNISLKFSKYGLFLD